MTTASPPKGVGEAQRRFAMSNAPLMPKATAVWLVDNTALTFDQVADFTKMHPLEVRAIADGDAAQGIKGMDPISTGQLSRDEIEKGEKDPNYRLKLGESKVALPPQAKKKGPRYTPVSRRHERPSAILWLVRNHPELKDAQIMRLVGTTKTTIASVRDRTHWNASRLTPMDPVTLGLCSQIELDFEVQRAAKEKPADTAYGGETLLPASETTRKEPEFEPSEKQRDDLNVDAVFAKLKTIGGKKQDDEERVALAHIAAPIAVVIPAESGEYAAAYRFHRWRLWDTGSPAFAGDDSWESFAAIIASQRVGAKRRPMTARYDSAISPHVSREFCSE